MIHQHDAGVTEWPISAQDAVWALGCRCPGCAACGTSVLGDDGGRFLNCMVCGLSVQYSRTEQ